MNKDISVLILYSITIVIIGLLLYSLLNKPRKIIVQSEPPQRFETHWWGYGWRPWWRKYQGVPGFKKMPKPLKPVIV